MANTQERSTPIERDEVYLSFKVAKHETSPWLLIMGQI